jgi:hypothetical protein
MQGNIVTAARWLFAGMVVSTALLVVGVFAIVHGEALYSGLFRSGAEPQGPCCAVEESARPQPPAQPSF